MEDLQPQTFLRVPGVALSLKTVTKFIIKNKTIPNITNYVKNAESPVDLLMDYVNFWARISGLKKLEINARESHAIIHEVEESEEDWLDII